MTINQQQMGLTDASSTDSLSFSRIPRAVKRWTSNSVMASLWHSF